jgi:hypothetical protein
MEKVSVKAKARENRREYDVGSEEKILAPDGQYLYTFDTTARTDF